MMMNSSSGSQKEKIFNTDLLLQPEDLALAKQKWPCLEHVLDHPELRDSFTKDDDVANRAKKQSQRSGIQAVLLAVLSLCIASTAPVWPKEPHLAWTHLALTLLAGGLGIAAVMVAHFGLLYGKRKNTWLIKRLRTERMRQFFFQTLLCRLPEIEQSMSSGPSGADSFRDQRNQWLNEFLSEYDEQRWAVSKMTEVLDANIRSGVWLHENCALTPKPSSQVLTDVFAAYRTLRFKAQLDFANYKLRPEAGGLSIFKMPLREQQRNLRLTWWFLFVGLVMLDVIIVAGALASLPFAVSHWPHLIIVWLAISAIGVRTIESGMALSGEIERYSDYRVEVAELAHRFDTAHTDREKLALMREMEIVSFEEMKRFLRQNNNASFVM